MEHNDELLERILLDLKNIFQKDPLLDEFGILPVPESIKNKSPVVHVASKLALEAWCVKPLYIYVYNKYFDWKRNKFKIDDETLLIWTGAILLINPAMETAWNTRKELLCKLQRMVEELKFSELVLSRIPKSPPVYAHRKWILIQMAKSSHLHEWPEIIKQEFFLCSRVANLYASNYYAWSHRTWIVQELLMCCLKTVSEELTRTDPWVSTHVSDHSGFHYRQFLLSCYHQAIPKCDSDEPLPCILHFSTHTPNNECFSDATNDNKTSQFIEAINMEMMLICSLQTTYPGHETLWYHRRYILHEFKFVGVCGEICTSKSENMDDIWQSKRHKSECDSSLNWNVEKEENFLNHCISMSADNKWERTLIERHLEWMNNTLLWPISVSLN